MITPKLNDAVPRDYLRHIALPDRGNRSAIWQGVQHGELIDTILVQASNKDLVLKDEAYVLTRQGHNLFGRLDFETPPGLMMPPGTNLSLGVRHSNLGDYAVTFAVGAVVIVCSNGIITGEFIVKRRHTIGVDLPQLIDQGLDQFINVAHGIKAFVEHLQNSSINDFYAARVMIEAGRRNVIPWARLEQVQSQWFAPTHDEFKPRTKWSLYNAVTEVLKETAPSQQMARIKKLGQIITNDSTLN